MAFGHKVYGLGLFIINTTLCLHFWEPVHTHIIDLFPDDIRIFPVAIWWFACIFGIIILPYLLLTEPSEGAE